ncbi:hypothetical protein pkur_cds_477 [Pandoravirus kuranda]|uniref:F-box domain-containing protein n=1 Tax=Pandoravirus kuranda TaxID=3019033 RepID=A0AA95EN84_9VIRU|nr:hypothetical protein pkur_cds_477 [Pandoravirus kuranda]
MDETASLDGIRGIHHGAHDIASVVSASLLEMPQEIFEQIIVLCDVRSVCMLGRTCRLAHAAVGCEHIWRLLFDRDFRHMYGPDLDVLGRVRVEWPPLALDVVGQQLGRPFDLSVPDPSDDPRIPGPFSRMRAYGKDWRWLYAVHCEPPRGRRRDGPATMYACQDTTVFGLHRDTDRCPGTKMYALGDAVGYWITGYGVRLVRDCQDRVVAWKEGLWEGVRCTSHVLMAGDGRVLCVTHKDLFSGTPAFFHDSSIGETTWGVLKGRKWIGQVVRKSAGSDRLRVEPGDCCV